MTMSATANKQQLITTLFTTLRKHYSVGEPPPRPVLEQMVYALLREGATCEEADAALERLKNQFFDWNEVRVSSDHELIEALAGLPEAAVRAERIISLLQEVFESTYSFDLESFQKKGLKQAAKQIGRYQAANEFTVAWVTQQSLGGQAIPIDTPTLRTVRRLGLVDSDAVDSDAVRTSLEHQVPKAKSPLFSELISLIARDYCWDDSPNCSQCPLRSDCLTGLSEANSRKGGQRKPKPR
jgi:endonuclease III